MVSVGFELPQKDAKLQTGEKEKDEKYFLPYENWTGDMLDSNKPS